MAAFLFTRIEFDIDMSLIPTDADPCVRKNGSAGQRECVREE